MSLPCLLQVFSVSSSHVSCSADIATGFSSLVQESFLLLVLLVSLDHQNTFCVSIVTTLFFSSLMCTLVLTLVPPLSGFDPLGFSAVVMDWGFSTPLPPP
ncbi:unnamed protein product [Arabidopsis halleri]